MGEWVKRNTLRWLRHIKRMGSEGFVNKVYVSGAKGPTSRGRPPGKWRDRVRDGVKEYMCEGGAARGGGLDQARRECLDRQRSRVVPERGEALQLWISRYTLYFQHWQ